MILKTFIRALVCVRLPIGGYLRAGRLSWRRSGRTRSKRMSGAAPTWTPFQNEQIGRRFVSGWFVRPCCHSGKDFFHSWRIVGHHRVLLAMELVTEKDRLLALLPARLPGFSLALVWTASNDGLLSSSLFASPPAIGSDCSDDPQRGDNGRKRKEKVAPISKRVVFVPTFDRRRRGGCCSRSNSNHLFFLCSRHLVGESKEEWGGWTNQKKEKRSAVQYDAWSLVLRHLPTAALIAALDVRHSDQTRQNKKPSRSAHPIHPSDWKSEESSIDVIPVISA